MTSITTPIRVIENMTFFKRPLFIIFIVALVIFLSIVISANKNQSQQKEKKLLVKNEQQKVDQKKTSLAKKKTIIQHQEKMVGTDIEGLYKQFIDILQINDHGTQQLWLQLLFQQQIQKNPILLIEFLANLNNKKRQQIAYHAAFTTWIEIDLAGFKQWQLFISYNGQTDHAYAAISLLPVSIINISDALLWINNIQSAILRDSTIKQVITLHTPYQGKTLINWALSKPQNKYYLSAIYKDISNNSPTQALQLFNQISTEEMQLQKDVLAKIGLSLSIEKIDDSFILAIEAIQNKQLRNFMTYITLPRLIKSGLIDNVDQLLRIVYSAEEYPIQQSRLAAKWAKDSPEAAMQYSEAIESQQQKKIAITSVIRAWAESDINAADNWLKQRSQWGDVNQAAAKLATVAASSPESIDIAVQWLHFINIPKLQNETTHRVIKNWYAYDQMSAIDYLEQSNSLSYQQKEIIIRSLAKTDH